MSSKTSLTFGEQLDISQAHSLHGRLERALQKSSTIELKADAVTKTDTAGLQLVLSLKNEVEAHSGSICWKNPSPALISSAKMLGLFEQLGLNE